MNESFGAYRVIGKISEGALSSLYKAEHRTTGRHVVIKSLARSISPSSSFAAQLNREMSVLASLSHPNIVLMIDFVTEPEKFLVLEYVDGFTLAEIITRLKVLSTEFALAIAISVVRAIGHASLRGVVHRDVKPRNVLVSKRGEVKLADFGIAQRARLPSSNEPLSPIASASGGEDLAFGTPEYMSPEQILGDFVDARSDLFSLGVVLYEMLSGTRPFESQKGEKGRASRSRESPAPYLTVRAPNVSKDVARVVMKLVERHPSDRFETPAEVEDELMDLFRRRTHESVDAALKRGLFESGLVSEDPKALVGKRSRPLSAPTSNAKALAGFGAIGALFLIAGVALESFSWRSRESLLAGAAPLPLVPASPGYVRVLAVPWADVSVDGERFDTTPFARMVPLKEGTHFLTFTHPDAPPEKREVRVRSGESTTVEVLMQLSNETDGGSASSAGSSGSREAK